MGHLTAAAAREKIVLEEGKEGQFQKRESDPNFWNAQIVSSFSPVQGTWVYNEGAKHFSRHFKRVLRRYRCYIGIATPTFQSGIARYWILKCS